MSSKLSYPLSNGERFGGGPRGHHGLEGKGSLSSPLEYHSQVTLSSRGSSAVLRFFPHNSL